MYCKYLSSPTVDFVMCGSVSVGLVLVVGSKDHLPSSCPRTVPCPVSAVQSQRMRWFSRPPGVAAACLLSSHLAGQSPFYRCETQTFREDVPNEVRFDHVVLFPDLSHCLALGLQLPLDHHRLLGPYSQALQVCAGLMFSPRLHGNCLGRVRDCPRQSHPSPPG